MTAHSLPPRGLLFAVPFLATLRAMFAEHEAALAARVKVAGGVTLCHPLAPAAQTWIAARVGAALVIENADAAAIPIRAELATVASFPGALVWARVVGDATLYIVGRAEARTVLEGHTLYALAAMSGMTPPDGAVLLVGLADGRTGTGLLWLTDDTEEQVEA